MTTARGLDSGAVCAAARALAARARALTNALFYGASPGAAQDRERVDTPFDQNTDAAPTVVEETKRANGDFLENKTQSPPPLRDVLLAHGALEL